LRDSHDQITAAGGQVVAIAPDSVESLKKHLSKNSYPFEVVADTDGKVFDAYDVTSRLISLGQQPALFIVDSAGKVQFDAVGNQQWDLISPKEIAAQLSKIV
jgi:thioredoxin-dependent peroxiredoxin